MSAPSPLIQALLERHRDIAAGSATVEAVAAELDSDPEFPLTEAGATALLGLDEADLRRADHTIDRDWFVLQAFHGTAD